MSLEDIVLLGYLGRVEGYEEGDHSQIQMPWVSLRRNSIV